MLASASRRSPLPIHTPVRPMPANDAAPNANSVASMRVPIPALARNGAMYV
ncbi:Uncharacterised protein [Burkholderia pseudomallei]|nr:Uncharacterised protein [Burkholderia pseudomallei]